MRLGGRQAKQDHSKQNESSSDLSWVYWKGSFFNKLSIYTMGGLGKPPASLILGAFTQYFKMVILLLTLLHICSGPLADEV